MSYFLLYIASIPVAFAVILLFLRDAIPGPAAAVWVACLWPVFAFATFAAILIRWLAPQWERFDNWWMK